MIKKWAADVANQGVAQPASLLMRSAIKPLLKVDQRSLLAVGLSRTDVVECLATPLTTDPTEFQKGRAGRDNRKGRRARARERA